MKLTIAAAVGLTLAASIDMAAIAAIVPTQYQCVLQPKSTAGAHLMDDQGRLGGTSTSPVDSSAVATFWRPGHAPQRRSTPDPYAGNFVNVTGINNRGGMVGMVSSNNWHPVYWPQPEDGGAVVLPLLPSAASDSGSASAINDKGHTVGQGRNSENVGHAIIWRGGKVSDLGALSEWGSPREMFSSAADINDNDDVVGTAQGYFDEWHAVLWPRGNKAEIFDLSAQSGSGTYAEARAINNQGLIVGSSNKYYANPDPQEAVAWRERTLVRLKGLTSNDYVSHAHRVNDQGVIVGLSQPKAPGPWVPVIWHSIDAVPVDPNTMLDANGCQDASGRHYAIVVISDLNNLGEMLVTGAEPGTERSARFKLLPH
jgi:probable HAF family extracellular repeat protein